MTRYSGISGNWRTGSYQPSKNIKTMSKTFEILDATGGRPKPCYIYRYTVCKAKDESSEEEVQDRAARLKTRDKFDRLSKRVRISALTKAIECWLEENQPDDRLYFVTRAPYQVLAQFAFQGSEFTDDQDEENCNRTSCYTRQVTIENSQLIDSKFVPVDVTYKIVFKTLTSPLMELHRGPYSQEIRSALESIVLADIEEDERFAYTRMNLVHKLDDLEEGDRRIINLRPYLSMNLGLSMKIIQFPSRQVEGEIATSLRIYESSKLFLEEVNLVKLLQEYFEFDVSGPLEPNQIERVRRELQFQTIEMRVEDSASDIGDHDDDKNYVTCIKDVSLKSIAEELCEFPDQLKEFTPSGQITVEQQFRREYPDVGLEYTHLPCLISPKGRKMPIEVCWIKRDRPLERCPTPAETQALNQMTHNERLEIFEKNWREFITQHCSTLKKFGFKLSSA